MSLAAFLTNAFADGRVCVTDDFQFPAQELHEATELLVTFEKQYRDHLPASPPEFIESAALHGAITLYRVCQFVVFRDLGVETIRSALRTEPEVGRTPAAHYSVDLTLRLLPDAYKLANTKAGGDPLLEEIVNLAVRWPLSSVGIPGVSDSVASEFLDDVCLRGLYVDRIIAREDLGRLGHRNVKDGIERAIGCFPELAPRIAAALDPACNLQSPQEMHE